VKKIEEILNFFEPVNFADFSDNSFLDEKMSFGNNIIINGGRNPISDDSKFEVVLVFVNLSSSDSSNEINTTQIIREEIYRLKKVAPVLRIADFGNLRLGNTINDTLFALQESCAMLFQLKKNVVVIGGPQALTVGAFRAFKETENDINLVHVDSKIDISFDERPFSESYLETIIEREASHLYNICCMGYQSYFVDQRQLSKLNELYFENLRIGNIRNQIEVVEPYFRDADLVSFDIGSIRMCDAPGRLDTSPNGFYAEEACQLARYAGISDRLRLFGLFETDAKFDKERQTTKLAAQIIWYYLEGYVNRKHDFPLATLDDCTKYVVEVDEIGFPIVFYKSNRSKRWWIEVNNPHDEKGNRINVIVSCSEEDYLKACNNEIPDRWWLNFKKMR
jgi:arginase family enzyme